ncbi:hypothetical protein D3C79_49280 [compost metagenome]
MKAIGIALLVLLGLGALGGVALFLGYQSMHDNAITIENDIKRLDNESQNVLSSMTIKIQTLVGLNKTYTDGLKEVITAAVTGRYGDKGSQATMQWIQEQNPNVDSSMFKPVQAVIIGGNTEFQISQTRKNEVCTSYETMRDTLVRGFFLRLADFPKKDVLKLCQIVVDEATENAFKTGKREATIK